jgi:hypothetical protein
MGAVLGCSAASKDAADAAVVLDFDGALPISGSLTVRVATPFDDAGAAVPTFVLLGDGTRFAKQVGPDGVVQFIDPDLRGPQDVTVVTIESQTTWGSDGGSATTNSERIETHLGVVQSQVDYRPDRPHEPPEPPPLLGRVEGTISPCGDGRVDINVAGEGIVPYTGWTGECGSYSLEVRGTKPGPLTVVARNTCWDYDICWPKLVTPRIGMVSGITFDAAGVAKADVVMDDTFPDYVDLQLQGLPANYTGLWTDVIYTAAGQIVLERLGDRASPLHISVPAKNGPLGSLERWVAVGFNDSEGYSHTVSPLGDPPVVRIPADPEILEPAGTSSTPPPEVSRAGLRIRWDCSSAGEAELWLTNDGLRWTVRGSCPQGSFTPFDLPSIVPQKYRSLPNGGYGLQLMVFPPPSPIGTSNILTALGSFMLR